ncbi:MAG: hypothetical protein M0Z76_08390 [Gammaproteobacteria bacterium]|nr:hypothetical protein [Gammaproteobacteria bacterium]
MDSTLFVLRRAWLFGECRRSDIDRAFGTVKSPNRAAALLQGAVQAWPHHLIRLRHRGVFPNLHAVRPAPVEAGLILDLLAQGAPPQETGVFPGDGAPILKPVPKPSRALTPLATRVVLDAALHERPIRALYVGLRVSESGRWRLLWPRALEHTGLFWRLYAQDLEAARQGFPIKTYVLARILEAQPLDPKDVPKDFTPRTLVRRTRRFRVFLSEALTSDQVAVVRNQLDIQDGIMTWPDHALHAFRREFVDEPVPADIVWPLITRLEDRD